MIRRTILLASLASFAALAAVLLPTAAAAQDAPLPLPDYRTESWYLPQSPSVTAGPAAGLWNPAAFAATDRAGADFWWNDRSIRRGLDNYGFAFGRELNFAMQTNTWGNTAESWKTYDYQLGLATGTRRGTFGLAYRWTRGETGRTPRQPALSAGLVSRHDDWISFGASGAWSFESSAAQYVFDLGLRPFGRNLVTLFADYAVDQGQAFWRDGGWSAGLELRPVRGIHLGVRARDQANGDSVDWQGVIGLTVGDFNATVMPWWDDQGDNLQTAYLLRSTPSFAGFSGNKPLVFKTKPRWYALSLENKTVTYQKYRYFDDKRVAWLDLLHHLNAVRDDDAIGGLALNLAGMTGRPSLMWELRQKLLEIRAAGKEVVIHGDRFMPWQYYLASAADRVTVDPWGMVAVPGFSLARSYLKGTLEKLQLGFQELRYFKFKSAAEMFARTDMSPADREQRQRVVDVLYEQMAADVAEARGLDAAAFTDIVDEQALLTPEEALAAGLVDAVARWDDLTQWVRNERGGAFLQQPPRDAGRHYWSDQWGVPPTVPVVYAVGSCDMDTGIKGRKTSQYLRALARDPHVKAVVLRADSPGGDPLPSDLVADAVRELKEAGKPVIVSQGDVAASGGYWISMDGSEVLTTPLTITGSIGVIAGWIWDDGFAGKLGVTSDAVSRGRHADLFSLVRVPYIGPIPRRPMNDEELARAELLIKDNYDKFVAAVAAGRGLDEAHVREVAQGRVWMGGDAIERGLCDRFGTLEDAIGAARAAAGIADWKEVRIAEYPPRPLFPWPNLMPRFPRFFGLGDLANGRLERMFRVEAGEAAALPDPQRAGIAGLGDLDLEFLRSVAAENGRPLFMVHPDELPTAWRTVEEAPTD